MACGRAARDFAHGEREQRTQGDRPRVTENEKKKTRRKIARAIGHGVVRDWSRDRGLSHLMRAAARPHARTHPAHIAAKPILHFVPAAAQRTEGPRTDSALGENDSAPWPGRIAFGHQVSKTGERFGGRHRGRWSRRCPRWSLASRPQLGAPRTRIPRTRMRHKHTRARATAKKLPQSPAPPPLFSACRRPMQSRGAANRPRTTVARGRAHPGRWSPRCP